MNDTTSATEEAALSLAYKASYENGPLKLRRDEFGLLRNVDYKFTELGHVDWKSMIDPKFLYPNKDWFEVRKQEVPNSIDGLEDSQLLIQLGGIKELARLRGYTRVDYRIDKNEEGYVSAICTIDWIPNYETLRVENNVRNDDLLTINQNIEFSSMANATFENTSGFGGKFLETIAENRSFVRAVRNFLNIHIVGADEIDKSKNKVVEVESENSPSITPHGVLEKQAINAGFSSYEDFRQKFLNPLIKDKIYTPKIKPTSPWTGYADIPPTECRIITPLLKKK